MCGLLRNDEKNKELFYSREKVIRRRIIFIVIMLVVIVMAIVFIILDTILWNTGVVTALSTIVSLVQTIISIVCIVRDQKKQ